MLGLSRIGVRRIFCFAGVGIVFLQGILISLRGVLKLDFQFFSGVFRWGFENVLDYQEELRASF